MEDVSSPLSITRPRRTALPKSALPKLTLDMFPPQRCLVLTPRTDCEPTWALVRSHHEGQLVVLPDGDPGVSHLSLGQLAKMQAEGKTVLKALLPDDHQEEPPAKIFKTEAKDDVKGQVKTEAKAEAEVKAEVKTEVKAVVEPKDEPQGETQAGYQSGPNWSEPVKVKIEETGKGWKAGWEIRRTDDETRAMEALRTKFLVDPGGKPQHVFRGACAKHAIKASCTAKQSSFARMSTPTSTTFTGICSFVRARCTFALIRTSTPSRRALPATALELCGTSRACARRRGR